MFSGSAAGATPPLLGCENFSRSTDVPDDGVLRHGDAVSCEIRLGTAPASPVTLRLSSTVDRLDLAPAELTFSPEDWGVPRQLTISVASEEFLDPSRAPIGIYASVATEDSSFAGSVARVGEAQAAYVEVPRSYNSDLPGWPDELSPLAMRIAVVDVLEPLDNPFELVRGSTRVAVEGGMPAVLWLRPKLRPRTPLDVTIDTTPGYLYGWKRRHRFTPTNWKVARPFTVQNPDNAVRERQRAWTMHSVDVEPLWVDHWAESGRYARLTWVPHDRPVLQGVLMVDDDHATRQRLQNYAGAWVLRTRGRTRRVGAGCDSYRTWWRQTGMHHGLPLYGHRLRVYAQTRSGWRLVSASRIVRPRAGIIRYEWSRFVKFDVARSVPRLKLVCDGSAKVAPVRTIVPLLEAPDGRG